MQLAGCDTRGVRIVRTTDLGPPALGPELLASVDRDELEQLLTALGFGRRQTLAQALAHARQTLDTRNQP